MMLISNISKNESKEELPRIERLTLRLPLGDLDLDFFARKFQIRVYNHCETVQSTYAHHYISIEVHKYS
jgi:hypothetical protein